MMILHFLPIINNLQVSKNADIFEWLQIYLQILKHLINNTFYNYIIHSQKMGNQAPSRVLTDLERSQLLQLVDFYYQTKKLVDKCQLSVPPMKNLPDDQNITTNYYYRIEQLLPYSITYIQKSDEIFSMDSLMRHIFEEESVSNHNHVVILIGIMEEICQSSQGALKYWLIMNIGMLYAKLGQTYTAQLYINNLLKYHVLTEFENTIFSENYEIFMKILKSQKMYATRFTMGSTSDQRVKQISYIKEQNRNITSVHKDINWILTIILAVLLPHSYPQIKQKIQKKIKIQLPQSITQDKYLQYTIKLPNNLKQIFDSQEIKQFNNYCIINITGNYQPIFHKNPQLEYTSRINQYTKPLILIQQVKNGNIYHNGYYYEQYLTNQEKEVTIKQQDMQKVYQQFRGDEVTLLCINIGFTQKQIQNLQEMFGNLIIIKNMNDQSGINFINKDYTDKHIYVATHIPSQAQDWRPKDIMSKIRKILIFSENNIKVFNDKTYFYKSKQQLLKQIYIQIWNEMQINMPSGKTPNFLFMTDQELLKKHRENLKWIIAPHCKQDSKNHFIEFLRFLKQKEGLDQIAYNLQKLQTEINLDDFRKQFLIINRYTAGAFFYRVINRGLRSLSDPLNIPHIRYPAAELFRSILSLHVQQIQAGKFDQQQFYCYRGCALTKTELQKMKKGAFVQSQGFMSTSKNKTTAKSFYAPHLLIIKVRPTKFKGIYPTYGTYADITKYSTYPTQEQILFNLLNWFRVVDVHESGQIELEYVPVGQIVDQCEFSGQIKQQVMLSQGQLFSNQKNLQQCINYNVQKLYKVCVELRLDRDIEAAQINKQVNKNINKKIIDGFLSHLQPSKIAQIKDLRNYQQIVYKYLYHNEKYRCTQWQSLIFVQFWCPVHRDSQIVKFQKFLLEQIIKQTSTQQQVLFTIDKKIKRNQQLLLSIADDRQKFKEQTARQLKETLDFVDLNALSEDILGKFRDKQLLQICELFKKYKNSLETFDTINNDISKSLILPIYVFSSYAYLHSKPAKISQANRIYCKVNKILTNSINMHEIYRQPQEAQNVERVVDIRCIQFLYMWEKTKKDSHFLINYGHFMFSSYQLIVNYYIGLLYQELKEWGKCLHYYRQAIQAYLHQQKNYVNFYFAALNNSFALYRKLGRNDSMFEFLFKIVRFIHEINNTVLIFLSAQDIKAMISISNILFSHGHVSESIELYSYCVLQAHKQSLSNAQFESSYCRQFLLLPLISDISQSKQLLMEGTDYRWMLKNIECIGAIQHEMGCLFMIVAQFLQFSPKNTHKSVLDHLKEQLLKQQQRQVVKELKNKLLNIIINHSQDTQQMIYNLAKSAVVNQLQELKAFSNFDNSQGDIFYLNELSVLFELQQQSRGAMDGHYQYPEDKSKYEQIYAFLLDQYCKEQRITAQAYMKTYLMLHNLSLRKICQQYDRQLYIIATLMNIDKNKITIHIYQQVWNRILIMLRNPIHSAIKQQLFGYLQQIIEFYESISLPQIATRKQSMHNLLLNSDNYQQIQKLQQKQKDEYDSILTNSIKDIYQTAAEIIEATIIDGDIQAVTSTLSETEAIFKNTGRHSAFARDLRMWTYKKMMEAEYYEDAHRIYVQCMSEAEQQFILNNAHEDYDEYVKILEYGIELCQKWENSTKESHYRAVKAVMMKHASDHSNIPEIIDELKYPQ